MEFTAAMIAAMLDGTVEGDPETKLHTIAKIEEGHEGALSFLSNPRYEAFIYTTGSSAVLVSKDFRPVKKVNTTLIRVEDPYVAIARLLAIYEKSKPAKKGIHPTAVIEESAIVGKDVYIGAYVVISDNAVIGDGCRIYPHVFVGEGARVGNNSTLYAGVKVYTECVIGNECIIHGGVVIGADGFGFAPASDNNYLKIPQIGNVILEDNVEVGANSCIDRATMGSTIIHKGVKIDNLVQVAHNVVIGENTVIAAQTGIAGSSKVGRNCMFGGQSGMVGHITIADGVKIGAQTGIIGSVKEENSVIMGTPSLDYRKFMKSYVYFGRLQEMNSKIEELSKEIESLKK
jgi:UDP-3-O-[3-hydroxymyristoyl] glucosamine N-acyltransferase